MNGLTGIKHELVKSFFILIGAERTKVCKFLPRYKPKGLGSTCCWAVPRKVFAEIYCYTFTGVRKSLV